MNSLPVLSSDLEPWIIVEEHLGETKVATWRIEATGDVSIAIFSTHALADGYAAAHCSSQHQTLQLDKPALVRLLADSHRQGTKYTALDPSKESVRQVFVIRDLLLAAREELSAAKKNKPQQ